jgi:glutaredoxin
MPPLHDQPYLIVYGRDSCGFTQQTLQELRDAGIAHQYQSVDDREVADVLHARMKQQGLDTGYYLLPVVDLNNTISIRPDNAKLLAQARELHLSTSP